jgi:hypothetical protein
MKRLAAAFGLVVLGLVLALGGGAGTGPQKASGFDPTKMTEIQERLLSGAASLELLDSPDSAGNNTQQPDQYFPRGSNECANNIASNIKVNQNCLNVTDGDLQGRAQAQNETSMAQDPNNPNHMIASYNDYRRGDGHCYASYSSDKGRTWNDTTIPFSFTRGRVTNVVDFGASREYWGGGGDTSVTYDSKGNAYMSCQVFNRGRPTSNNSDTSSALLVFRSTKNNGASWNFPGRYARVSNDTTGSGVSPFLDKQLMTADSNPLACPSPTPSLPRQCTPFQDRVYVTWTEFAEDGSAYIYETYSADYGEHFSPPHLVSANSPLCTNDYGAGTLNGGCNENQFSQPFVGPDGVLYVVWNNYNNEETKGGNDNRNQILLAKSVDGGNTFTAPVKVSDYYDLPDCPTYQAGKDFGRACVPEKAPTANSVFRAANYASGAVNPTNPSQVVVTLGSYINVHSKESNGCVPTGINPATGNNLYTGVKTPGACNNDILVSISNDGGTTFTGTTTDPRAETVATQEPGQATTDQWWQWIAFSKNGKLATSYYDRQYGDDEVTGYSDVSLSGSGDYLRYVVQRVSSSPMPPPSQFAGTFWGDYTGLSAVDNAYPLWSDTRNPDLFICPGSTASAQGPGVCTAQANGLPVNDQDIYIASLPIPSK